MPAVVTRVRPILLAVRRSLTNAADMSKLAALVLVAASSAASAEPAARLGVTLGLADQSAPGIFQIGPQASLGEHLGAFTGELDYAYLSFFDPYASPTGVHRFGLTLRAELMRDNGHARQILGAHALFVEAGGAERFGKWQVDATHTVPANSPVPEGHVGLGLELDNRLVPHRYGWQVALRFAVSPADPAPDIACRGSCPMTSGGGLNRALLMEWMFLFGG